MKNNTRGKANAELILNLSQLPGEMPGSKKVKISKIIKYRALVFEKQITNTFEIIF